MSIVVGYIPTREGRAALRRAAAESELRKAELIVINSDSGKNFDPDDTLRFEAALEGVQGRLVQAGVNVEVRQLVRGKEPAEDLIEAAESSQRRAHRHRSSAAYPRRQAHPRVQRPAHPAGRDLPGSRGQGHQPRTTDPTEHHQHQELGERPIHTCPGRSRRPGARMASRTPLAFYNGRARTRKTRRRTDHGPPLPPRPASRGMFPPFRALTHERPRWASMSHVHRLKGSRYLCPRAPHPPSARALHSPRSSPTPLSSS